MTKKIKKSVSILLALIMLCGVLAVAPVTVGAAVTEHTTSTGGVYTFNSETGELHLVSGNFTGTAWISNETWTVNAINPENILSITAAEPVNGVKVVKFTGDCSRMFGGYPKSPLEKCVTIDLSNVDTSAMTKTNRMFNHDKSLSTLNLSGINTSNVTDMDYMFNDCPSLTTLDLSSFNTNKLKVVEGGLFAGCTNLKNLTISQNFKSGITGIMKLNNGILKKGWVSMDGTIVSGSTTSDYAVIAAPVKTTTYVWLSNAYEFIQSTGELHLISGSFSGNTWQYENAQGVHWTANQAKDEEYIESAAKVKSITANPGVKFTGDCKNMFKDFSNCETIDLSNVDTSNTTNMYCMFYNCTNLTDVDVSNFDTSNVTAIRLMFGNCGKLTELDLSSFDTGSVINGNMPGSNLDARGRVFTGCSQLRKLTISDKFNIGIEDKMELNNGRPTDKGWITSDSTNGEIVSGSTTSDYAVIAAPEKTTTYVWYSGSYEFIPETGELHLISGFFNGNSWQYEDAQGVHWASNQAKDEEYIESAAKVKTITANPGVTFTGDCKNMFRGFSNCETIDLSNVDTSNTTNMYCMFYNCTNLTDVDVSNFDTSNVTAIRLMFGNCGKLTELDLSSFDTGSVINGNMPETDLDARENVFLGCSKLRKLTISDKFDIGIEEKTGLNNGRPTDKGWITSDSTNGEIVSGGTINDYAVIAAPEKTTTYVWYSGVYEFIPETGELHLISGFFNGSYWQYEDAQGMHWTANQAKDEEYIESAAKVKSITANPGVKFTGDCKNMFKEFSNCETIDLSNVDTSNVTNMYCMFYNCTNLTDVDVSNFDTSNVTAIRFMFGYCGKLTELDLSSFDTGSVINGNMPETDLDARGNVFGGCSELRSLTISDGFNLGIQSKMALNNGGVDGWRISPSDYADRVSGDGTYAVMEQPSDETTYKWIEYATVTWNNWDDTLLRNENYKLETIIHPTYKGVTPVKTTSDGKSYMLTGWTDGKTEYSLNDDLPYVTQNITYTAIFTEGSAYTLNYIYQGRNGGNKVGYIGDDLVTDTKTYTVTVELGASDLKESGMPKDKVLVDNAPVVNDPYKDCKWTFTDKYVVFDSDTKTVTITAEQPERKYSVVFKDSNNATTDVFRVKLNEFVQKSDSFITAEETDGSGQPFAYWSVTQNGKEVARCFEKRFNLRVTGDSVVTAHYGEASNLVTLSDAEISRQKFTENGVTKDLLYADFITAYMNKQGMELSKKSSSEYKTGMIVQYSQNVKVAKENAPGETLSESDKKTFDSGDLLSTENAKTIANGGTVSGKYSYLSAPIDNSKYNDKNRLNKSLVFTNTESVRQLVLCAYYYVYNVKTDEIEMTDPVYFYLYDIGNAIVKES